jgi:hypothetical protein
MAEGKPLDTSAHHDAVMEMAPSANANRIM